MAQVRDICTLQHNGDKPGVEALFEKYGKLSGSTLGSLAKLEDVSVDIRPCFPLAGEDCEGAKTY